MKLSALILVAILGAVAALPLDDNALLNTDVNTRNNVFEELILELLEELRETMVTGSDDLPVLDPLMIDELYLELDELGLPNSHLTISDVEVRQLSTFVIEDLTFTSTSVLLQRYDLVVDGYIPVIDVDCAKYDLSVNALGLNIFGAGDAKIRLIKPRITATIGVGLGIFGGITITIRSADVVFHLDAFESQITGLFGTNMTDDFVNMFLSNLLPELVEFYRAEISEVINSIIEGIGSIDLTREDIVAMSQALERFQPFPVDA